tara:strand:- start:9 stop:845 length:837 start_codon:yes stop_codon:yes gene_type:complete
MNINFLLKRIFKKFLLIYKYNKFLNYLITEINEKKYSTKSRYRDLLKSYELCGLGIDRDSHINKLNKCLNFLNLPEYDEKNGMFSEHLIIFSAISDSSYKPKRILEIGTYDGKTAAILSYLFPDSEITTIDLNDNDPIFKSTYNRFSNLKVFIKSRNDILKKNKNIKFIQCNSLELTLKNVLKMQDLIWVDGDHVYPTAAIDITNSIKLLNKNGILMCDDIWKERERLFSTYDSIAGYETLNAFSKINFINNIFFQKRICKEYNRDKKYIGFSKKLEI